MKRFNKLICLMLALVMMLSLASLGSIMAEKAETETLTLNPD